MKVTSLHECLALQGGPLWSTRRARRLFRESRLRARNDDVQLAATQEFGVIPQAQYMAIKGQSVMLALAGTENFLHADADDFIISLRSFEGGVERCFSAGCVSPAYTVLKPSKDVEVRFFAYLLKSVWFISILQSRTTGIREGKTITYSQFASIDLPLPSLVEQSNIADFLDRETADIDALVEKYEQLIERLEEKRLAMMSQYVTKGTNARASMKESGIKWIGEIPSHWRMVPLKYLVKIFSGSTPDKNNEEYWRGGKVPWASAKDLKVETLFDTEDHITDLAVQSGATLISEGNVLTVVRGMILARALPVVVTGCTMAINQDLKALRPHDMIRAEYLANVLRSIATAILARADASGHGTKVLRFEDWARFDIPLPPLIEQDAIVSMVADKSESLASLSESARKAIALSEERRSALITGAVTGQIDVSAYKSNARPKAIA